MPRPTKPEDREGTLDANQIVAYNFREARRLRGWTQEQTAFELSVHSGTLLKKASISGIETSYSATRRRVFTAHELAIFALTFDVPIVWFFVPPENSTATLANTAKPVQTIWPLTYGTPDQADILDARLAAVVAAEPASQALGVDQYRKQWLSLVNDFVRSEIPHLSNVFTQMKDLVRLYDKLENG